MTTALPQGHALHAWHASRHALHGVSLQLDAGQALGLPGHILVAGQPLWRAQPHAVAGAGLPVCPRAAACAPV